MTVRPSGEPDVGRRLRSKGIGEPDDGGNGAGTVEDSEGVAQAPRCFVTGLLVPRALGLDAELYSGAVTGVRLHRMPRRRPGAGGEGDAENGERDPLGAGGADPARGAPDRGPSCLGQGQQITEAALDLRP